MPLYRLEENFSQMNIDISRTSMARWAIQTADFLGDLAFEIKNYILSQKALHADETTIQVLHEPGKKAQTNSYMWMIYSHENTHPSVWFQYESGRAGVYAKSLLEDFSGLIHIDGYLHNEWPYLIRFLDHGAASLSNNRIENHVRPFAIGRKNWLFADTTKGADASAILYTVIATAKANRLSVRAYLKIKKIFSELPGIYASQKSKVDLTPFLPWNCTDCLKPQQK